MSRKEKVKWYSLDDILKKDCQYNVIFGERSNGKTYAVLSHILENWKTDRKQGALVRRFDDDIIPSKAGTIFNHIIANGDLKRLFKGAKYGDWTGVRYYNRAFYLTKTVIKKHPRSDSETEETVMEKMPFMYVFSLTQEEDYKENAFPYVTTLFFDEFLTRKFYLPEEFVTFENLISTIKRKRKDFRVFMCGNTINQYCPYFSEMGLTHVRKQKKGTIEVYTYGETKLRVAVEYADTLTKDRKDIDEFFAFDNPKLRMITQGDWEFDIYPHCPIRYEPKDVRFSYFILFEEDILECDIIQKDRDVFTYIHRKTTPVRKDTDIVFSKTTESSVYKRTRITKPTDNAGKIIWSFFVNDKVFYQDNEIGEEVRNYLLWSSGASD